MGKFYMDLLQATVSCSTFFAGFWPNYFYSKQAAVRIRQSAGNS